MAGGEKSPPFFFSEERLRPSVSRAGVAPWVTRVIGGTLIL